jgi:hypothetical protein
MRSPMQNAHGPDFYPRPNKPVRVRIAKVGPLRALAKLDSRSFNPHPATGGLLQPIPSWDFDQLVCVLLANPP